MAKYYEPNYVLSYDCSDVRIMDIMNAVGLKYKGTHSMWTNDYVQYYEFVDGKEGLVKGFMVGLFGKSRYNNRTYHKLQTKLNKYGIKYSLYGINFGVYGIE